MQYVGARRFECNEAYGRFSAACQELIQEENNKCRVDKQY
jgi:hypothetical protein